MLTGKGKVGKDKDTGKGKGKAHRRLASLETLSTPSDIVAEALSPPTKHAGAGAGAGRGDSDSSATDGTTTGDSDDDDGATASEYDGEVGLYLKVHRKEGRQTNGEH
eukprot:gene26408-20416_t